MRLGAGVLSLLLLLASAAPPALADGELVVDDAAASVQISGVWVMSTTTSGFLGSGSHFRVAGDGTSTFAWPFSGPAARYEVFAR